jgi:hypothetical protein
MSDFLKLKRFSEDKHEQIEQLIVWCQMMGLTGRDLVSIGGKLDRMNSPTTKIRDRFNHYREKYKFTLSDGYNPSATFVLDGVTFVAEDADSNRRRSIAKWKVYPKGDVNMARHHPSKSRVTVDGEEHFPQAWQIGRRALYNLLTDIEMENFRPAVRKTPQE